MPATVLVPAAPGPEQTPRRRLTLVHPPERGKTTARGEIQVLVAHGQTLVRAGMRGLLEGGQSISVVGEASDRDEAIVLAQRLGPDVVLMDATLPDLDVEAIRQISALADVRVMMLTAAESDERVFQSLRAGVTAFLV